MDVYAGCPWQNPLFPGYGFDQVSTCISLPKLPLEADFQRGIERDKHKCDKRVSAKFCENLRFPEVFCERPRLPNAVNSGKSDNLRETVNLALFLPFSLYLFIPPEFWVANCQTALPRGLKFPENGCPLRSRQTERALSLHTMWDLRDLVSG